MMNIVVIGLGYVGLPLALRSAERGHKTVGLDLNKGKLNKIRRKVDPIGEKYIADQLKITSLVVSDDPKHIDNADIILVCVPTPVKDDYQPDLGPVMGAVSSVAKHIKKGTVLIIESTINPGVCDEIVIPLMEKNGLAVNKDYYLSHCPERINPGDSKWNVTNIPRVVGSSSNKGLTKTVEFYESILDAPIKQMGSLKEAEACKVVENSFRDVNIAFVNELAKSFSALGINVKNVIDGAATKPFAFMPHYPSLGVGGHCIPVDPYYLIEYARSYGFDHEFLQLARNINNSMPSFTVDQLIDGLNEVGKSLNGSRVLVLGLSYKANVADDRESPSYELISILKQKKAKVSVFDPFIRDKSTHKNFIDALKKNDAVVLATNHSEFETLPSHFKKGVFVDGKNMFVRKDFGNKIVYRGIGTL